MPPPRRVTQVRCTNCPTLSMHQRSCPFSVPSRCSSPKRVRVDQIGLVKSKEPQKKALVKSGKAPSGEAHMAAQLGLDVSTYQMLRRLERRDIRPEDYELLGRLDEVVKPSTLHPEQLQHFPTQIYFFSSDAVCDIISDKKDENKSFGGGGFGMDFWKLPLPRFGERQNCLNCSTTGFLMNESCSVCLAELEEGDLLRVLPCSHHFHRECIDHWLLHSSTACPACKCDLSQEC